MNRRIVAWSCLLWLVILLFGQGHTRYVVLGKSEESVYGAREKESR